MISGYTLNGVPCKHHLTLMEAIEMGNLATVRVLVEKGLSLESINDVIGVSWMNRKNGA